MIEWPLIAFMTILGAIVGSFLNVCIYRLPLGRSIVWPASACESCHRPLAWFENIPLASYLALRGRCRTCAAPLSLRHPLIEALTAAMFGLGTWYFGPSVLLVSRLVFGCALIVLFAIDLEHHLLPNAVTLPGIVVGFAFSAMTEPGWLSSLIGILVGGGDVKMLAMIGAFIGWQLTIVTLMMASFAGSIVGVALIASRRGDMKYALPFGTFLAMGAALAATVGQGLLTWYLGFYS
jgi:leader peptidase (prepilin peptidase)/N-methyltransferase